MSYFQTIYAAELPHREQRENQAQSPLGGDCACKMNVG